ncbi:low molecular weight phosphotyrosine protein phosphatase [bacterium]|nr:low molecular weight phosphotyrosine protein phosphatase [bacterium]
MVLRILILCHGNICRSPLAEVLIDAAIGADPLLAGRVVVSSAGTSDEHAGEGMHENSAAILNARGLRSAHQARHFTPALATTLDLVLAADQANLRNGRAIIRMAERQPKICLLRDFDPAAVGRDLDDPWGYPLGAYERVAAEITAAIPDLLAELRERL